MTFDVYSLIIDNTPTGPLAATPDHRRLYEIRCPVHGFIEVNHWEREVINHPTFQRLRRIRQLGWTEYVYPGATHTRFEHSLGVMHIATRVYDAVAQRSRPFLESCLQYDPNGVGIGRDRQLVRFAALLHDVGHAPFSHVSEELMPIRPASVKKYRHEDYSASIVRQCLREVIEGHPFNDNVGLTAEEIASLIDGTTEARRAIFWRELVDGQMDADRMDYLLRDSTHLGVQYGRFDLDRIISTIVGTTVGEEERTDHRLAVDESGLHAAIGLVLARYYMFTQVYFHKTRVAYDTHLREAIADMLPAGVFPPPRGEDLEEYIKWDDWAVLGKLAGGRGGTHGERLRTRSHYREITHTSESPKIDELIIVDRIKSELGDLVVDEVLSKKSWYKTGETDIPIITDSPSAVVKPLSTFSPVIEQLKRAPHRQVRLYALPEYVGKARSVARNILESKP